MAINQFSIAGRNDGRLYNAVRVGDQETVVEELRRGDVDPNLQILGKSLLHHAGKLGFNAIARLLIEYGANPDQTYGKQRRSLLNFAVATGNYGFLSVLLEAGANASSQTASGATPLHFASRAGEGFMVARLLAAGADRYLRDRAGRSPLDVASDACRTDVARQLKPAAGSLASGQGAKVAESAEFGFS